ncbi:MAG: peptidoglycan recognition family protein [Chloroflexota bacterium]
MTYPFVAAKYFTAGGMTEPHAVVVHMAEGGGTVSWLTHPTNDNSSHFVIEYSGRIVQMVKDADASHSLRVAFDADTNDAPDFGIYSAKVGQAVLGTDGWADPNRYLFAVELEGFAAAGPNADQVKSLTALIADLRGRHPSIKGLLGHRDFQDYKACPGGKVPWASIGGHGLFAQEVDMFPVVTATLLTDPAPRVWRVATGVTLNGYDPAKPGVVVAQFVATSPSQAHADAEVSVSWIGTATPPVPRSGPFLRVTDGALKGLLIVKRLVTLAPASVGPTQADLAAAAKAGRAAGAKAVRDAATTEAILQGG